MRINKFIAAHTNHSRRKADELISDHKVFVNGKMVQEMGTIIDPENDRVEISGKPIAIQSQKIYLVLNKPKNFICTRSDELNRQTIMDLIPKGQNLKPVGRLDKDSEGLILLSNDGAFINRFTHPKFECEKEYFVTIKGSLTDETKTKLENGIKVDGRKTAKAKIQILKQAENQTNLRITIHEGRNRQIRKMFAQISTPVKYLQRIRIGKIKLHSLKTGAYRALTNQEINVN